MPARSRLAPALVALVASLFLLTAPALADPVWLANFGGGGGGLNGAGTAAGQLAGARELAIDASDNIFVADVSNNRISEFTHAGTWVKAFGWGVATGASAPEICTTTCQAGVVGSPYGAGQLDAPVGLALDASGNVYAGDNLARVSEFSNAGNFLQAFGWGVFNGAGQFQTCTPATGCQIGTTGAGAGELSEPFSLAIDGSGNIWVSDTNLNRIDVFSSTPTFTKAFGWGVATGASAFETCSATCQAGSAGAGDGQLGNQEGIAFGPSGDLFVANTNEERIDTFTTAPAFSRTLGIGVLDGQNKLETCTSGCRVGSLAINEGAFFVPSGVAVDPAGNVWVADHSNHRVQEFDPNGNFRLTFGWGVQDGASAFEVCRSGCRDGLEGTGDGQFGLPWDLGFDSAGDLFVADDYDSRIEHFDVGHNVDVTVAGTGSGSVSGPSIACPSVCSAAYSSGSPETLFATPAAGSTFTGWSGACTGTAECSLTIDGDKRVTATFASSSSGGSGGGSSSGGGGTTTTSTSPTNTTTTPTATPAASVPPPVEFTNGNAEPVQGAVLFKLPGTSTFVPITKVTQIPVGSIVDARKGRVRITIDAGGGQTATADFFEGEFQFLQKRTKAGQVPFAVMVLFGGSFASCPGARGAQAAKAKSIRHLWGQGSGPFRTQGRYASATIRGTTWDTDDRCDGTNVKVTQGAVTVRDLVKKKNVVVKAGHQYLAKAPAKKR